MRLYQKIKNTYHLVQAIFANLVFDFPSRKIKIIGVTGTNGKTTTVWIASKILEEAGFKVALSSTINFKIGKKEWVNKTKFTTLSAWKVQKFIRQAVDNQCDYLILETSSHALDQNRVWGVNYDTAVITNITREHLDYHINMESYKNVKRKLFSRLDNNFKFLIFNFKPIFNFLNSKTKEKNNGNQKSKIENRKAIVVNLGMKWAEEFLEVGADEKYAYCCNLKSQSSNVKTISQNLKFEKIETEKIKLENNKSEFMIGDSKFVIHLPGQFNVENALAAICVGLSQGVNLEICAKALKKIKKIPGRMDYVENKRGFKIIIDYAVTPDSMEKVGQLIFDLRFSNDDLGEKQKNLLNTPLIKEVNKENELIWVFGACGERDQGKRPMMGEIVSRYADVAIVTNEDPYGEKEDDIIEQILSGMGKLQSRNPKSEILNSKQIINNKYQILNDETISEKKATVFKIIDRREAIKKALEIGKKGDIILITGKGAEETMALGNKKIPWNDRQVVEKLLNEKL